MYDEQYGRSQNSEVNIDKGWKAWSNGLTETSQSSEKQMPCTWGQRQCLRNIRNAKASSEVHTETARSHGFTLSHGKFQVDQRVVHHGKRHLTWEICSLGDVQKTPRQGPKADKKVIKMGMKSNQCSKEVWKKGRSQLWLPQVPYRQCRVWSSRPGWSAGG